MLILKRSPLVQMDNFIRFVFMPFPDIWHCIFGILVRNVFSCDGPYVSLYATQYFESDLIDWRL